MVKKKIIVGHKHELKKMPLSGDLFGGATKNWEDVKLDWLK